MLKYVTLALSLAFATTALADEAKNDKSICPTGMICLTPEQLQSFTTQQIESAKLQEMSTKSEIQDVLKQYQKVIQSRTPEHSPMPLNPEPPTKH